MAIRVTGVQLYDQLPVSRKTKQSMQLAYSLEMMADLNWDSLENRRKWNDLRVVFFFKIQNSSMDIPFPNDMVEYHRS